MDAVARLMELAEHEPLAQRLLTRVTGVMPNAGFTVDPLRLTRSAAEVIIEGLFLPPIGEPNTPGATLRRIIGFLKTTGGRQTTWDIADACGIGRTAATYHLHSGPFIREGFKPVLWSYSEPAAVTAPLTFEPVQGCSHAST